eukprot:1613-Heterococcus_DN1.PRE.1
MPSRSDSCTSILRSRLRASSAVMPCPDGGTSYTRACSSAGDMHAVNYSIEVGFPRVARSNES